MKPASDLLPKLLGGTCRLFTTSCIQHELKKLGADFVGAVHTASSLPLHTSAPQRRATPASSCCFTSAITPAAQSRPLNASDHSLVRPSCMTDSTSARVFTGTDNANHFFVATQDKHLRHALLKVRCSSNRTTAQVPECPIRQIPAGAVINCSTNGLHLAQPSDKQEAAIDAV